VHIVNEYDFIHLLKATSQDFLSNDVGNLGWTHSVLLWAGDWLRDLPRDFLKSCVVQLFCSTTWCTCQCNSKCNYFFYQTHRLCKW